MKHSNISNRLLAIALVGLGASEHAQSDTFGSGPNTFTIDFVTVGNPGNANDGFWGRGGVSYTYRMGVYEIPQEAITKATNLGMTNVLRVTINAGDFGKIKCGESGVFFAL